MEAARGIVSGADNDDDERIPSTLALSAAGRNLALTISCQLSTLASEMRPSIALVADALATR